VYEPEISGWTSRRDDAARNLIMVPAWPGQQTCAQLTHLAAAGERPRTDYVELARALQADVMDMEYLEQRASPAVHVLVRRVGTAPAQVAEAFLRRHEYEHVVARADRLGLPLALLHKLARTQCSIVLISVWLSRPKKAVFLKPLRVHTHLGAIINYGSVQMGIAAGRLKVPDAKLHHAPQPVDERFWHPHERPTENMICAVGSEARDYATFMKALNGVGVHAEVAVGTTVFKTGIVDRDLAPTLRPLLKAPPNVRVHQQLAPIELRELYARSRFVVVPLEDVEFDAGVTCIAEAMAMGKAVIASRGRGQVDLVRHGRTGIYVPPGDPRALRGAVEYLLQNVAEAERMGRAGRAEVEARLTLDGWVSSVASVTLNSM
jgi:glycosyltransferase involved in cell wall biosynthesis